MLKERTIGHPSNPEMSEEGFLTALVVGRVPVAIYLRNGIKLLGEIEAYESYGLFLRGIAHQFIYKHAISTILPSRDVSSSEPPSGDARTELERRARTLHPPKPRVP